MIDWIDSMCKAWGRCSRSIISGANSAGDIQGYPTRDTIERARQGMLNMKDRGGPHGQHFAEVRVGDALVIANAMKQTPLMPEALQAALFVHYVVRAKPELRVKVLARYIGRARDREAMPHAEYWRLLDRAHYFLLSRIPAPNAEPDRAA